MDLMDEYRRKIENNESCSHTGLETQIYFSNLLQYDWKSGNFRTA